MKQTIRLTESKLKQMIAESVRQVLKESEDEQEWYHWDDDIIRLDPQDGISMVLSCQGVQVEVDGNMPLHDAVTQLFRKLHF